MSKKTEKKDFTPIFESDPGTPTIQYTKKGLIKVEVAKVKDGRRKNPPSRS